MEALELCVHFLSKKLVLHIITNIIIVYKNVIHFQIIYSMMYNPRVIPCQGFTSTGCRVGQRLACTWPAMHLQPIMCWIRSQCIPEHLQKCFGNLALQSVHGVIQISKFTPALWRGHCAVRRCPVSVRSLHTSLDWSKQMTQISILATGFF